MILDWMRSGKVASRTSGRRILAYCASNIGMGPYARLCRIMGAVKKKAPNVSILVLTDARNTELARQFGLAVGVLPRYVFSSTGNFQEEPENLSVENSTLKRIRENMILSVARTFAPDLFFADTNPHGKRDEIARALVLTRKNRGRTILMMRDIPATPDETFKLRGKETVVRKHSALYDQILIAGDRKFFDAGVEYNWSSDMNRKVRYTGFVIPRASLPDETMREAIMAKRNLDLHRKLVVVSCGGGWDSARLLTCMHEGLNEFRRVQNEPCNMIFVTGPAASDAEYAELCGLLANVGSVSVERFPCDFPDLLQIADMAVLQAGSTIYQVLESSKPVIMGVRSFKTSEQQMRASRLSHFPGIRVEDLGAISGAGCHDWLRWGLCNDHEARSTGFNFNGVEEAAGRILGAINEGRT